MARGYGFRVYVQPILPTAINLALITTHQEARTAIGSSGFMDITTLASQTAVIHEHNLGYGLDYHLTVNGGSKAISNAELATNVVTLTVPLAHGLVAGDSVTVAALPSPFAALNGVFTLSAHTTTSISYAKTASDIATATVIAGTVSGGPRLKLDGTDKPFRIMGIESGPFNSATDKEESPTWDDESLGYKLSEATGKSGSISFQGLSKFTDASYNIIRLTEQGNVSRSLHVKLARVGPAGYNETIFGYGRFDTFKETNDAGKVVKWASDFEFYGPNGLVRHQ